jgi:methionine aminotransferase
MNSRNNLPITPSLTSRLPAVGTTVFTRMSTLATQANAVNLGQGFPDFSCERGLLQAVNDAMQADFNQYPMMTGAPVLRNAIVAKVAAIYGRQYDANTEITVTAGATQALTTAILCCVHPGDEVIVIEPAYDSYVPAINWRAASRCRRDGSKRRARYASRGTRSPPPSRRKTRLLHHQHAAQPDRHGAARADMHALADIVRGTDVLILSDEVYEHMVYDGAPHESVCRHPELAARAFVVSSFGKTYHVTGWKIGYVAAPAALTAEFRKVHQYNVFTREHANAARPRQLHGRSQALPGTAGVLPAQARPVPRRPGQHSRFEAAAVRRHLFPVRALRRFRIARSRVREWLTGEIKVAAIPVSAFYQRGQGVRHRALLLREERRDPGARIGAAG